MTGTGADKALNSHYTIVSDGYELLEATTVDDTMGEVKLDVPVTGSVGSHDNVDYFYISADDIEENCYYTLTLEGVNGNQIKAAVGYENPKGTFVSLQTVTGTAGSSNLMLSRKFTAADLEKLTVDADGDSMPDNKLIVKVFSANASANSNYTVLSRKAVIKHRPKQLTEYFKTF